MNIAFVHDYLHTYGGAERMLEAMHRVYSDAPIYTTRYVAEKLPDTFPHEKVRTSAITQSWFWNTFAKQLTFLNPVVFENMQLDGYDVVISSTSGFAKGVVTRATQRHICYCHTPPRFLYKYEGESTKRDSFIYRPFVSVIDSILRAWDYAASHRVDEFLTNSDNTAKRIKKFYQREAQVVYPPVAVNYAHDAVDATREHFLVVSRLTSYKHVHLAVEACTQLDLPLVVVGDGPEFSRLEDIAGPSVVLTGFVSDEELHRQYLASRALIYTAKDEDFGITPIEAMAHGRPVIAHRSGGMIESVAEGTTGVFYDQHTVEGLMSVLRSFDETVYKESDCKNRAAQFSFENFEQKFRAIVEA